MNYEIWDSCHLSEAKKVEMAEHCIIIRLVSISKFNFSDIFWLYVFLWIPKRFVMQTDVQFADFVSLFCKTKTLEGKTAKIFSYVSYFFLVDFFSWHH